MMDRHTQTNGSDSVTLTAYYICTKYWVHRSNRSLVRLLTDTQTDAQTDGTDSIAAAAYTGGNDAVLELLGCIVGVTI